MVHAQREAGHSLGEAGHALGEAGHALGEVGWSQVPATQHPLVSQAAETGCAVGGRWIPLLPHPPPHPHLQRCSHGSQYTAAQAH